MPGFHPSICSLMTKTGALKSHKRDRIFHFMLLGLGLLLLTMYFCNHYFFRTNAFDYGAYNFAFYDYAHFQNSIVPVYPGNVKFIQDHVSFTLMLFIPLYWVLTWLTGTYTLLFIQSVIIVFGAWAVYRLIELKSENKLLPILAGLHYFLILGRWTSFTSDCNLAIMASSMVPVLLYFFEKKKWIPAALCLFFILTSREDMALWTLFIGFFFLITYRKVKPMRWGALSMVLISLAYFIIVFRVIIPAAETPEKTFTLFNYSELGKNPGQAVEFILRHPVKTLRLLFTNFSGDPAFDRVKFEFYTVYLISGGVLLFLRPRYLILFIPIIAKKMLNDDPVRWSVELYYSIEFVSILPVAVFLLIASFRKKMLQSIAGLLVCVATLSITAYKFNAGNRVLPWWWITTKYTFFSPEMYSATFDVSRVNDRLSMIPGNASVCASGTILPHLAFRENIRYFPWVDDAEYLVVFTKNDTHPLSLEQFDRELEKYLNNPEWEMIVNEDPLLILKKKDYSGKGSITE